MKKILIVSNNEFLNILYVMNLEVYLGVGTTLVESTSDAIELLKGKTKFDLILTLEVIKRENSSQAITKHLKSYGQKIPIISTGAAQDEEIGDNYFAIAGKYNVQNILKTSAKILGVTAKQMAELDVGKYYPISVAPLLGFIKAPCRIYINQNNSYKSIVGPADPMGTLFSELNSNGIEKVFVNSQDRLVIINSISLTLIKKITMQLESLADDSPIEKKIEALSSGYEFAAANLFSSDEIKTQMQEIAVASAKVMGAVAKDNSSVKGLMDIMLSNRDGYIFTHSMIVSYVTYHMIKNVSWGGEGQVEKINFVLFFHDIFLAPIYLKHPDLKIESALLENEKLSEKEKDTILNHAKLAAELVVSYKRCPLGADVLIKQHHGMKKGKGFVKIYMEDLSPLSKIILIAEMFVEEFLTAHEANQPVDLKIVIPKLISQFKTPSYTKMVQTLVNVPL